MINLESETGIDAINLQGTAERQEHQPKAFHASQGTEISYDFDKQSQRLVVSGCILDEIVVISTTYPDGSIAQNLADNFDIVMGWEYKASEMVSQHVKDSTEAEYSRVF